MIYARGPIESRLCPRFNLLLARTLLLVRKVNRDAINDTCALGGVRAISRDEGFNLFAPFFFSLSRSFALPFLYYVTSSANFFSFSSFSCEIPREVSRYVLKMLGNRKMHVEVETITFGLDKANRFSFLLLLLFFSPLSQGNSNSSSKFSREWKLLQGGVKVSGNNKIL